MKAWIIERHGGLDALQLSTIPDPTPAAGEARVKVRAVSLNHLDLWVRKGVPGHEFPLPLIPGCDVAGEIDQLGPLSANFRSALEKVGLTVGSRVLVNPILSCGSCASCRSGFEPTCPKFGLLGETRHGGCSDYVNVPVRNLIALDPETSFDEAACIPIAFITAWSMLTRKTALKKGELILIQAGASGVSIAAIQIAKLLGAHVITTVGSAEKGTLAKSLGADEVINYKESSVSDELKILFKRLGRRGVDVAIDHNGTDTFNDSIRALDWGGRLATCGATSGSKVELDLKRVFFKNLAIYGSTMGSSSDLPVLLRLLKEGKLRSIIDSVLPMGELPKAHEKLESRTALGKIVLTQ